MTDIRSCDVHGVFVATTCPTCDGDGSVIVDHDTRVSVSKFISGALRHFPGDVGLSLDEHGWVTRTALLDAIQTEHGTSISEDALLAIVQADKKGRFEVDEDKIRAAYGHSVDVDINGTDGAIPETLYHGTAPRSVESIMSEGLQPQGRQHVHLTDSKEDAENVGRRHASGDNDPIVFSISVAALDEAGHTVTKRADAVYTTDHVPPRLLTRLDN